jgi:hypothetical protein
MTTPTGQISFSQIATEFGTPPLKNIGAYRVNQSIGNKNWNLDDGIPTSGSISFSQLKGKTANVIVDYPPLSAPEYDVKDKDKYDTKGIVVGGFKGVPGSNETKKIYHLIRETIGGYYEGAYWDANTVSLNYLIYDNGQLYGYGGKGGAGATGAGAGSPGGIGNTAFFVRHPCNIINNGYIQCGFGGGGGGGGSYDDPDKNQNDPVNSGGGGGGGAGLPGGAGGKGGTTGTGGGSVGTDGSAGEKVSGGGGGGGGNTRQAGSTRAGNGGNGRGVSNFTGGDGGSGTGGSANGAGGSAGSNGFAISRSDSSVNINYSGSGTLIGNFNKNYVYGINANGFQYEGGTVGQNYYNTAYGGFGGGGECSEPFGSYYSGQIFATGGSGKNLSFNILKSYVHTSSGNPDGNGGYYCTWNYVYTLSILQSGYNYNSNDTIYVNWDGRSFAFNPLVAAA